MITKFKDYNELPFSKKIQNELFKRHTHGELTNPEEIVYTEKDVLILMQMLQSEIKEQNPFSDSDGKCPQPIMVPYYEAWHKFEREKNQINNEICNCTIPTPQNNHCVYCGKPLK